MKTNLSFVHPIATLAVLLMTALPAASARTSTATEIAAEQLARNGYVAINAAGPYVEVGTVRIQVMTKLGRPSATLADGTWLYQNQSVGEGDVSGTLVVRFNRGRVSGLSLVTRSVAHAMTTPRQVPSNLMAAQGR